MISQSFWVVQAVIVLSLLVVSGRDVSAQMPDPRTESRFAPQSRLGRYTVLYPNNMRTDTTYRLVVLLHGNGHGPETMLEWARQLDLNDVIYICPEAPYLKWTESIAEGKKKYTGMSDAIGAPDSLRARTIDLTVSWYRDAILDAQRSLPVAMERPMIIGFSQGGFYAHVLATRYPDDVLTVVTMCASMYPEGNVYTRYTLLRERNIEVLVTHGRTDNIVPFSVGNDISLALGAAGVRHVFVPFDGGHWPTPDITKRIRDWLLTHRPESMTEPVRRNGRR